VRLQRRLWWCGGAGQAWAADLIDDGISVNAYTPNAGTRSWFNMLSELPGGGL
jgi:hypothetical protein